MTISRAILALPIIAFLARGESVASSKQQSSLEEGIELYKAKRYQEAIAIFDRLLALDPTDWTGNYLTAVSYLGLYHPGSERLEDQEYALKGLAAFERTLEIAPLTPEDREKAENFYLSFLSAMGDRDTAIAYLERQLVLRPDERSLLNQIAISHQRKGEYAKALDYFERRANVDPTDKEAWYTLGVNCWARSYNGGPAVSQEEREQVVDRGVQALERALAIDPDYFDALAYANLIYREKAKALAAIGSDADAQQALDRADEYQQRAVDLRKVQRANAAAPAH